MSENTSDIKRKWLAYIESVTRQASKETEMYLRCVFKPNSKQEIHIYERCVKQAKRVVKNE